MKVLCVCVYILMCIWYSNTSESSGSHSSTEHVKLTTSCTVAVPLERSRRVSLPFTILPSLDFGALVLIPIISNHTHKMTVINQVICLVSGYVFYLFIIHPLKLDFFW